MAEIDITQDRRCRGRPQVRPDDETRRIIYEAARHEFAGMVSDRLDRFVSDVNLHAADHTDLEEALRIALIACADLALDEEVIAIQRMLLQEAGKFSDIAGTFYTYAIQRTAVALADWL